MKLKGSAAPRTWWVVLWALYSGLLSACPEWLEVPADDEGVEVEIGEPVHLPQVNAGIGGEGPFIPQSPGLRVPLAGYWARVRVGSHDLMFPYCWMHILDAGNQLIVRIEASMEESEISPLITPKMVLQIPISLPKGLDTGVVRDGFALSKDALKNAVGSLRTSATDFYRLDLSQFSIEGLTPYAIVGALEGQAVRGTRGQRPRDLLVSFIALNVASQPGMRRIE